MVSISSGHPPHPDRVVILIDGNNLFMGARKFREGFKIDYRRLLDALKGENKLIRAYFFDCLPHDEDKSFPEKEKFMDMLRDFGITIISRPLRYTDEGKRYQKGVDVALSTELLYLCMLNAYDLAIIVSGDSDYAHAIDRVKHTGKNVHVAAFKSSLSKDLRKVADKVIYLDTIADHFELLDHIKA